MELFDGYPYLEDDRIIIHKMGPEDAADLEELTSDPQVYDYVPPFLYELKYEDKAEVIARLDEEYFDTKEGILMGIYFKAANNKLVGLAEIYSYDEKKSKASIGCRIGSKYWGKGISPSMAALMRDYLIKDIGLETVTAHIMQANVSSERSIAKSGFLPKYRNLLEDWGMGEMCLTDKYVYKKEWLGKESVAEKIPEVQVEQFVMAYEADQDRIRALLPESYVSLRPVLRINSEIRDEEVVYLEFNTPVEYDGRRGWLNIASWKSTRDDISFSRDDKTVTISASFIELSYTGVGIEGGCPAEKDNEGCYYITDETEFRPAEKITENKEFCDCEFAWKFGSGDARGRSQGKTLPAAFREPKEELPKILFTPENAAAIPCRQVLGSYIVRFKRNRAAAI